MKTSTEMTAKDATPLCNALSDDDLDSNDVRAWRLLAHSLETKLTAAQEEVERLKKEVQSWENDDLGYAAKWKQAEQKAAAARAGALGEAERAIKVIVDKWTEQSRSSPHRKMLQDMAQGANIALVEVQSIRALQREGR